MVQTIYPKGTPVVLSKLKFKTMSLGGVFRPFLKRSLHICIHNIDLKLIHPKGTPVVPIPKLKFHKMSLGGVFRPFLKRSLHIFTILI